MTLEELKRYERDYLTPAQVAPILHCAPYSINVWAKQRPEGLGFPVSVIGTRVRIPRLPFIRFMEGGLPWAALKGERGAANE